jgi:ATP phosphoribosyltransferase
MEKLRIAIPNKGRMKEPSLELLKSAGIRPARYEEKSLFVRTNKDSIDIIFVRVEDIPQFVEEGVADLGMVGQDIVAEKGAKVKELAELGFGKCSLVLAAKTGKFKSVNSIADGARIASKFSKTTKDYFKKIGKRVEIVELSGAVEIAPNIGLADAIVDLTSTGSTLKTNNLEILETVLESQFVLIGKPGTKGQIVEDLVLGIESVVSADKKKYLMANMPEDKLPELEKTSKGALSPTVTKLDKKGWIAVQMVVGEKNSFELIKRIKEIGGRDILVMDIERLVK